MSWWDYVTSPDFWGAVMENWQSEFLQFALFIGATVWLVQKGSDESKKLEDAGLETDEQQEVGRDAGGTARSPRFARADGPRTASLRELAPAHDGAHLPGDVARAQSLNNWRTFDEEQRAHEQTPVSWGRSCSTRLLVSRCRTGRASSWRSASWSVFAVYLRQRGSPESKPVGAPHDETGSSG